MVSAPLRRANALFHEREKRWYDPVPDTPMKRFSFSMTGSMTTGIFVLLFGSLFIWGMTRMITPSVGKAVYQYQSKEAHEAVLPFLVESEGEMMEVTFAVSVPSFAPSLYRIKPDDCLSRLSIDGRPVEDELIPFCDYDKGRTINLHEFLTPGDHRISATVKDQGGKGGFMFGLDPSDPLQRTLHVLLILFIAFGVSHIVLSARRHFHVESTLAWIFLFGVLLRVIYVLWTPYPVRAYDVDGHLEYIQYVVDHLLIPKSSEGWEYNQPPLYYFLMAPIVMVGKMLTIVPPNIWPIVQWSSLLLSIGTLLVAGWIGHMLFKGKQLWQQSLFLAVIAVFPGLIFFASRITNDTLLSFLSFLFLAFLIRWWQLGTMRDWLLSTFILALAILTKTSALPFVMLIALCLVFHPRWKMPQKVLAGVWAFLMLSILTGWYFFLRFIIEGESSLINSGLNSGLAVVNTFSHLTVFNPLQIVAHPYNNDWADGERRQFFWEYLFKSVFVGQWQLGPRMFSFTVLLESCSLVLLAVSALGFWNDLYRHLEERLPYLLTLGALLGSAFFYRFDYPYGCNQDYRFIPLLAAPVAYGLIRGLELLPASVRSVAIAFTWNVIALCTMLVIFLAQSNYSS